MAVIEREARIVNPLGMHVRPAAEFVKVANRFRSAVEVRKDDVAVNGKRRLAVDGAPLLRALIDAGVREWKKTKEPRDAE